MQSAVQTPPPAHQVALFKSAPRDYLNLGTIKIPYFVSYYIDESFHTTWVVRGRTRFKTLKGEDGLKFTISDHQFTLPKVEAVTISELPEYFRATGPGVDIILGRDFLVAYSFLFYRRAQVGLQLSRSCINRCKWPDKSDHYLDFYTAWAIDDTDKTKAGTAAFVNIFSPFSTWRPYKPCYWDPKEDIGLCAMTQAMKTATQMPALQPGPVINIITNDKYAYETYSPFMKVQHRDLGSCEFFLALNPRLRDIVSRFLEYRKDYAGLNGLEELSCVNMISFQNQEHRRRYRFANLEYAVQLAELGAKMLEFDTKGPMESQLPSEHYYHFDTKTQVFTVPKKEVNKTLREILQSYQKMTDTVSTGLSECSLSDGETPVRDIAKEKTSNPDPDIVPKNKISLPSLITMPGTGGRTTCPPNEAAPVGGFKKDKKPSPLTFVPKIQEYAKHRHIVDLTLEEELEKLQQSGLSLPGLRSILDRLNSKKVALHEKATVLNETTIQLQNLVRKSEEKGLAITERQRRNCDVIMAGAHRQQEDLVVGAALAAKHFKGVVEGYFIHASQEATGQPQEVVHPTNSATVDLNPIGLPPKCHTRLEHSVQRVYPINTHEGTASADARKRFEKHRLAVEKLQNEGKLPKTSFPNDIITAIDCRFIKSGDVEGGPARVDGYGKAHDISGKASESTEWLKMKAAKSKLESVEADLAAKFSAIDLKSSANRRYWGNGAFTRGTRNVEEYEYISNTPIRVLGGAIWPSKTGRGQLLVKNQYADNKVEGYPNPAAESNTISKDTKTEHKRSIQVDAQTNTKANPRKTSITEKVGFHTGEPSLKIPARYPGGAIGLANIGGIPGDRCGDIQRFPGEDRRSAYGEMYAPWSIFDPKELPPTPRSNNSDPEECVTSPIISQRTSNGILIVNRALNSPIDSNKEERSHISRGITPKQLAEMTELSAEGVQINLNKPIGTLIDALVVSPELRKTTVTAVNEALGSCFLGDDEFVRYLGLSEDQQVVVLTG